MAARRWSDEDHYLGPLTYARQERHFRPLTVVLGSGDEDYSGTSLRISGFGHTVILALPQWVLWPYREKITPGWDVETIARLGRDWYWKIDRREYGVSLSDGHLSVSLGRQTMDSSTEQSWGCFLPWTQWRHVRRSFYDRAGEHVATAPDRNSGSLNGIEAFRREQATAEAVPTVIFDFTDFDSEEIRATTRIEEREWRFGEGWFKWLSLFRKPRIERALDLQFSSEVGRRKGSWKGGTLGHGITMLPGELHEAAFKRYCAKNDLTYCGPAMEQARDGKA